MNIKGILFIEIYVGMGKMVAWWHEKALGFQLRGIKEKKGLFGQEITYWLQQGEANVLITAALEPSAHDVVSYIDRHGNSIKRLGIEVESINESFEFLNKNQAILLSSIQEETSGEEWSAYFNMKLFDENEITFVERKNCEAPFAGFKKVNNSLNFNHFIHKIDHVASVVRTHEAEFWNQYLCKLLNLNPTQTIGEEFFRNLQTGMKMFVLSSSTGHFNKVIVEPLPDKNKASQVDIFLRRHLGNGIQHVAFEVSDLKEVVKKLQTNGVSFTPIPDGYYDELKMKYPELPVDLLKQNHIFCEKNNDQYLFQVFTEPIGDRPTLFYEFVQRVNGYKGFGEMNVKQLFKSLELHLNNY